MFSARAARCALRARAPARLQRRDARGGGGTAAGLELLCSRLRNSSAAATAAGGHCRRVAGTLDDQHGTAIVTLAPLINALRLVGKDAGDLKVVFNGVGAAGVAVSKIFMDYGVTNLIGCDRSGAIYPGRSGHMNFMKQWYADHTNPNDERGSLADVIEGADVFIGLSAPGVLTVPMLKKMNRDAIVFAMANPTPEIMPEDAAPHVRIMATGRSDYPNQVNNVLAFPGVFRGALDVRATTINDEMKRAAAYAIAGVIPADELHEDYIIPSVFNKTVVEAVAKAVAKAARESGVARRETKG